MLVYGEGWKAKIQLAELHAGADVSEVLVAPLELLRMGRQVAVHYTEGGVV